MVFNRDIIPVPPPHATNKEFIFSQELIAIISSKHCSYLGYPAIVDCNEYPKQYAVERTQITHWQADMCPRGCPVVELKHPQFVFRPLLHSLYRPFYSSNLKGVAGMHGVEVALGIARIPRSEYRIQRCIKNGLSHVVDRNPAMPP